MSGESFAVEAIVAFNRFVIFYFLALNTAYLVLFLISLREVRRFVRRTFLSDYREIESSELTLPISVLVPAHNEERTIVETVRSLLGVRYGEFEIIVINDGSTDGTLARLSEAFELRRVARVARRTLVTRPERAIYGSLACPNLFVIDKPRGGKPDALNSGINLSRYPLFCSIDADSLIEEDALLRVVKPFLEHPDETVAVGGIVRVVNGCTVRDGRIAEVALPHRPLAILQALEYLRAFLAGRVGWNAMRSLLLISGAFSVFRKDRVIEAGGYSDATDTEDLELIVRLRRQLLARGRPYRMTFVPDPVCWTEVPERLGTLARQRTRWHRGLIQTLVANRGMLFNPRHGTAGLVGLPYFFLFEMLGPFVEIASYVTLALAWWLGVLDPQFFVLFLAVSILYGILLSVAAVMLEETSFRRYPRWVDLLKLLAFSVIENLGYRQLLSLFKVKAAWDLAWRRRRGWGRMERAGFRAAPAG